MPPPTQGITPSAAANNPLQSVGVYITYAKKEDAAKAIAAVDGSYSEGRILRASYGTTKYCTYYLRHAACPNPSCMYLHEPGEESESYTKEDISTGKYQIRDMLAKHHPHPNAPKASKSSDYSHVQRTLGANDPGGSSSPWSNHDSRGDEPVSSEASPEISSRNLPSRSVEDSQISSARSTPVDFREKSTAKKKDSLSSSPKERRESSNSPLVTPNITTQRLPTEKDSGKPAQLNINISKTDHSIPSDPFSDFLYRAGQVNVPLRSPISPNYKPMERHYEKVEAASRGMVNGTDPAIHFPTRKTSRFGFAQQGDEPQRSQPAERESDIGQSFSHLSLGQEPSQLSDFSHLPPYHPLRILQTKQTLSTNPRTVDSLFGGPDVNSKAHAGPAPVGNSFVGGIPAPPGVGASEYHSANEFFTHFLRRASATSLGSEEKLERANSSEAPSVEAAGLGSSEGIDNVGRRDSAETGPTKSSMPEFRDPAIMAIRYSAPGGVVMSSTSPTKSRFDSPYGGQGDRNAMLGYAASDTYPPGTISNSSTLRSVGMGNYFPARPLNANATTHPVMINQPSPFSHPHPPSTYTEGGHPLLGTQFNGHSPMTKPSAPLSFPNAAIQPISQYPSLLPNRNAATTLPTAYSHYGSLLGYSQNSSPANLDYTHQSPDTNLPQTAVPHTSNRMRLKIFENVTNDSVQQ